MLSPITSFLPSFLMPDNGAQPMNDQFTQAQKIQVVELMWQVAYADGVLDENEHHLISKIAGLLHVTHGEYIAAKMHAKATSL